MERLDPQVSKCGSVEGTVWYRINQAPDGTLALAVKAADFAPVLRVYQQHPSSIEELTCASAKSGAEAAVAFQPTRGNTYLILVGRRTGTADAAFTLTAKLFLPPANDTAVGAKRIGKLPGRVSGATLGATSDDADPSRCGIAGGTVWYALPHTSSDRIAVTLRAHGNLDAAMAVVRGIRSRVGIVGCGSTNERGVLQGLVSLDRDASYAIVVGQQSGSKPGDFTLDVVGSAPPERAPGRHLTAEHVASTLNGLTDVNDIWWMHCEPGDTYNIALASAADVSLSLKLKGKRGAIRTLGKGGYTAFTPGPDGGGRYVLEVQAPASLKTVSYHLVVREAGVDDLGVGLELPNLKTMHGSLAPQRADLVDLYHFDVEKLSEVRIGLSTSGGYEVVLMRDNGGRVGSSRSEIATRLDRGRYVVAVRSAAGRPAAGYGLSLVIRSLTSMTLTTSAREVLPGTAFTITPVVAPSPNGGSVKLQIDRFDPLTGWHFHRIYRIAPGASLSWTPPAAGRWRVRASYLGTLQFSPSRTAYVALLVAKPLPTP